MLRPLLHNYRNDIGTVHMKELKHLIIKIQMTISYDKSCQLLVSYYDTDVSLLNGSDLDRYDNSFTKLLEMQKI